MALAMSPNVVQLVLACLALVLLSVVVGFLMLYSRVKEMRAKRIHPQAAATSAKMAARLENIQPADNFRNLFEVPVLFYALVALAVATQHTPGWLVAAAWAYVALRVLHSFIHCTYNKVYHRLAAFLASFLLLAAMWVGFAVALLGRGAG